MRPRLSRGDIREACGHAYFDRGRSYFERGRVESVEIAEEDDGRIVLHGRVLGSSNRHYNQQVEVEWIDGDLDLSGECSCPMSFNCKHVAAVCLAYRVRLANQAVGDQDPDGAATHRWLKRLADAADDSALASGSLLYILKPGEASSRDPCPVQVELRAVKPLKRGVGHTKGRKVRVDSLLSPFRTADYATHADMDIGRLLYACGLDFYYSDPPLRGGSGQVALERMLETGRCHWQDASSPVLGFGEDRAVSIAWRDIGNKLLNLDLSLLPSARIVLTDPPMYIDSERHEAGYLDAGGFNAQQLSEMLSAPPIRTDHALQLSRTLAREFPELPLPAPAPIDIEDIRDVSPVPCLSLTGTQTTSAYVHLLLLDFAYRGVRVPAWPEVHQSVVEAPGGMVRVARDLESEQDALVRLIENGFQLVETNGAGPHRLGQGGNPLLGASRWSSFLRDIVPQLESEGWLIEQDEQFLLRFEAGDWGGTIDESPSDSNDWFSLRFDLNVGDHRMPLLPLIEPLLGLTPEELTGMPETVSVPLVDAQRGHCYIDLPTDRLQPFLDTLRELFARAVPHDDDGLRLSRYDAALLTELEQSGTHVSGGDALHELAQRLADFDGIRAVPAPQGLRAQLRPYQHRGLDWLQFLRDYRLGGILADDMGLGKTVQALAHLLVEKEAGRLDRPTLVVAPTSLMSNWRREAARFTPGLRTLVLHGPDRQADFASIADYDLVLTTYPLLPRDHSELTKHAYHYLILDEAQTVKNPRSKAAGIVRDLDGRHRLCLTGTPLENHLGELWAQFDFLMPGFLANAETFKRHWRTPIERHGDTEKQIRLSARVAPFLLRRRKQDVLTELPPKTEIVRSVPLNDKQATLYEGVRLSMEKRVRAAIAAQGFARSHITILDALLKLRQICCHPKLLSMSEANKVENSAKLDLLLEILPEMLEEGRRVLIFSQFTSMLALIETALTARRIDYSKLTGQTRNRDAAIEQFRSGEVDVFLISLKAGGVGLNLTEADTVILYDPWWNPAVQHQAADRAHRIGQDKPVFVYRLISEGTVEEKIVALQEKKEALADGVYRQGERQGAGFSAEDLRSLFEPIT